MENLVRIQARLKTRLQKAKKYCNKKGSARTKTVPKRGGGEWSWKTRTAWINKCRGKSGSYNICSAKWNMFRLRDAYSAANLEDIRLSKQVKAGWANLKTLTKDKAAHKAARKGLEPLRRQRQVAYRKRVSLLRQYNRSVKYYYTIKMKGSGSRKKNTAAKNRYYKWSWRWYLDNQCSAYKNALTKKTEARNALTKAKKEHEEASQKVRLAWNEVKKAKGQVAKAAAKKKVDEAKAERD